MTPFVLHPRLEADTVFVADWSLSRVLLMNDSRYPWLVLVPREAGLSELHDIGYGANTILMDEIRRASTSLKKIAGCAKINIGALGNVVPQLHIHIVARNPGDAAWPGPVWGQGQAVPYEDGAKDTLIAKLRAGL